MQWNNVRFQPGTATYATSSSSVNVDYCAQPEDVDAKKKLWDEDAFSLYLLQF